jgi:hypothetical protein
MLEETKLDPETVRDMEKFSFLQLSTSELVLTCFDLQCFKLMSPSFYRPLQSEARVLLHSDIL